MLIYLKFSWARCSDNFFFNLYYLNSQIKINLCFKCYDAHFDKWVFSALSAWLKSNLAIIFRNGDLAGKSKNSSLNVWKLSHMGIQIPYNLILVILCNKFTYPFTPLFVHMHWNTRASTFNWNWLKFSWNATNDNIANGD